VDNRYFQPTFDFLRCVGRYVGGVAQGPCTHNLWKGGLMKFEIREREIEMSPETEYDRDVLGRLFRARSVIIRGGKSTDSSYPPDRRRTNVVLVLPDPDDWGT